MKNLKSFLNGKENNPQQRCLNPPPAKIETKENTHDRSRTLRTGNPILYEYWIVPEMLHQNRTHQYA
jgi:hypothetical protein